MKKNNRKYKKKQSKLTSWIDQRKNDVEFNKRLGTYILDWIVGGIFTSLPAILIYGAVSGKDEVFSNLYIFKNTGLAEYWAYIAGLLCVLFALFYYVYVPYKIYPGQTLAKKWQGLQIVMENQSNVTLKALLLRQIIGLFIVESGALVVCGYLRQMMALLTNPYVDVVWQWTGSILLILSAMLVAGTNSHRAIHDYIAKTKVITKK